IGATQAMQDVLSAVEDVARANTTVLLLGESGTGKEVFARYIHALSPRAGGPWIAVNCAALPGELLESELFGHEKGSFTGAVATKVGKFELATGGSLFLDEVGSMRLDLQAKILRALQEREIERVGGTRTIKIDVRVIAATNRELKKAVEEGTFREDLYYRLNVVPITLPDLKDRQEDIPLLANHFVQKFSQESNPSIREISKEAMAILLSYSWPGNVRELENIIERAVTLGRGPAIQPSDLPPHLAGGADPLERALAKEATLEDLERDYIGVILRRTKGHQIRAASILGIDRRTLYRKIRRYNLKLAEE
ncbi:MAG TPA: sigma-54 dependent transcriptional regulator, partial [Candidatus Methylomirabilis sp.]|nr:sigma-54 dependent transcriptional regulator [Candidatus Methylomirabilis sp.]